MTPEERFTKIENSLEHSAALHAQHVKQIAEILRLQKSLVVAQLKTTEQIRDLLSQLLADRFLGGDRPNGKP